MAYDVGTVDLATGANPSAPKELVAFHDSLYFIAPKDYNQGQGYQEQLWRTDGTTDGTIPLTPLDTYDQLTVVGDALFLSNNFFKIWRSDGTVAGTSVVFDHDGAFVHNLSAVGDLLFFTTERLDSNARTYWRTDGTNEGTFSILETPIVSRGERIPIVAVGQIAYFSADDGVSGRELWRSDGTIAGTYQLRDILSGPRHSNPASLTNVNGTLYFTAGEFAGGTELWKTDGTAEGTVRIKNFGLGRIAMVFPYAIGDQLLFSASDSSDGPELWISDGTDAGTRPLNEIVPGSAGVFLRPIADVDGTVFFTNLSSDGLFDLWRTDGTSDGTVLVTSMGSYGFAQGTAYNGNLFFNHFDTGSGIEVWRSDGTEVGTGLIVDVAAGSKSSAPTSFVVVDENLFFAADDLAYGHEVRFLHATANTPSVTDATTRAGIPTLSGLVVTRNAADGSEVSHVKVTGIANGTLYLNNGVTQVNNGQFVPFDEAMRGFKFKPADDFVGTASFMVQASTSASDEGLGGEAVMANITVLAGLGTAGNDNLTLRKSADGTMLEIFNGNPPAPGATPIFTWPMNASVPLPINTLAGNDGIIVDLPAGATGPAAGILLDAGSGRNFLDVRGGQVRMDSVATGGELGIIVIGLGDPEYITSRFDHVQLAGGDATILAGGDQASVIIGYDPGTFDSVLDVTDNDIVFQPPANLKSGVLQIVSAALKAGYADGVWTRRGITSATAAANPNSDTGLALVDNALLGLTEFSGVAVDENSILLKYTYYGDIDLNGRVDGEDLTTFALNFGRTSGATQVDGDIDFNGTVDGEDLTVFALNFGKGIGAPLAAAAPKDEGQRTKDEAVAPAGRPGLAVGATAGLSSSAGAKYEVQSTKYEATSDATAALSSSAAADHVLLDFLADTIASRADGLADPRLASGRKAPSDLLWAAW